MGTDDLKKNFISVITYLLEEEKMNVTSVVKSLGYTTTFQLNRVIDGDGLPSAKALEAIVKSRKINPHYLFLGRGDMFLSNDESETENLIKMNRDLLLENDALRDKIRDYEKIIEKKDVMNENICEMAAVSIKSLKEELKQLKK
jgi:hypothetical protein